MKKIKKALVMLLSLAMILTSFNASALAAGSTSNLTAALSATEVNVGDTFTVTVSNKAMTVSSFTGGLGWDKTKIEYVSFAGGVSDDTSKVYLEKNGTGLDRYVAMTAEEGNNENTFGMFVTGGTDVSYKAGTLFTITFRAIAAGDAGLYLYENSAGTDGYKNNEISIESNVTVKANEETTKAFTVKNGSSSYEITVAQLKAATKVTGQTWSYTSGKGKVEVSKDFYSLASILSNAGITVDSNKLHGISAKASDGFINGFTSDELDDIYIYLLDDGSYGTAINGSAGNKWGKGITDITIAEDCVQFYKGGCKHYCAICGKTENYTGYSEDTSWSWSEDYTQATLTINFDCGKAEYTFTDADEAKNKITSEIVKEPEIGTEGEIKYTASIKIGDTTFTSTKTASIPALVKAFTISDGTKTYEISTKAVEAATKVTGETWSYTSGEKIVEVSKDFYSLASILKNAGITVDTDKIHGISAKATDGFINGFTSDELDDIYIYLIDEGSYGTAINGSAGNKWGKNISEITVVSDCVMFFKKGSCKHYCAICGKVEDSTKVEGEFSEDYSTCEITVTYKCGGTAKYSGCTVTSQTTPAECTKDGKTVYTATVVVTGGNESQKKTFTYSEEVKLEKLGHKMTHYDFVPASFDKDGKAVEGNIEYYECSECGKFYEDEEGTKELKTVTFLPKYEVSKGNISNLEVTEELEEAGYETVDEVKEALQKKVIASEGFTAKKTVCYDLTLMMSLDNGKTYVECTKDNFPKEGVKVVIPYPEGTDKTYDFVISHMFTAEVNGYKPGEVEKVSYEKTDDGLVCTFMGLSPVCVGWKEPVSDTDSNTVANSKAKTGDSNNMTLWIIILALAAVCGASAYAYKKCKKY